MSYIDFKIVLSILIGVATFALTLNTSFAKYTGRDGKSRMDSNIEHMWNCRKPDSKKRGAGFPILENARHTLIFAPDRESGAYNHHSQLTHHNGAFHAMWSNHTHGEDGPGQRILYAKSKNATDWREPAALFPAPKKMIESEKMGVALTAFQWIAIDDRLFAVAGCHENVGFCDFEQTDFSPVRDEEHPSRARKGYSTLAREVSDDGEKGSIFAIREDLNPNIEFDVLPCDTPKISDEVSQLRKILTSRPGMPAWDFRETLGFPDAFDGHRLCEPTVYRKKAGQYVMLLRDTVYSHRMYFSTLQDDGTWAPARPTDIPDSPSLSDTVILDDGTVLLIGNQMAPKFDNPEETGHYSRDPLMVSVSPDGHVFEKAFALRCGVQEYRVPQSEVRGRGGGAQYPSATVHEGTLYVQYSMGKEDICVSWVPLAEILD